MSEDLGSLRGKITKIDEEMARLFEERMRVSTEIAAYKQEHGLPIYDPKREAENLLKAKDRVSEEVRPFYTDFLIKNMELSKAYQRVCMDGEKQE